MATTKNDDGTTARDQDAGEAEVQAKSDEAAEQGYFGTLPDETPFEAYTLKGVAAGKPTPETTRTERA